jgi:hypothetical protein
MPICLEAIRVYDRICDMSDDLEVWAKAAAPANILLEQAVQAFVSESVNNFDTLKMIFGPKSPDQIWGGFRAATVGGKDGIFYACAKDLKP